MERGRSRRTGREERSRVKMGQSSCEPGYAYNGRAGDSFAGGSTGSGSWAAGNSACGAAQEQLKNVLMGITHTKIKVRHGNRTVARIPASVGIAGLVGSLFSRRLAIVGAIGLAGAYSSGYRLELEQKASRPGAEEKGGRQWNEAEAGQRCAGPEARSWTDEQDIDYHWEYPEEAEEEVQHRDRSFRRSRSARNQYCQ